MVSSETLIRPLPLRIGQDLQTYMKFAHFCGLASYYRTFVPGFANIARPLHDLTRKNATFKWSDSCETSFTELKRLLTSPPILGTPRDDTDASDYALGVVLQQEQDGEVRVIAYASRALSEAEEILYHPEGASRGGIRA